MKDMEDQGVVPAGTMADPAAPAHADPKGIGPSCAILVASFDGISSRETGVGTIAHNFFEGFEDVMHDTRFAASRELSLYAIAPYLAPDAHGYRPDAFARTHAACKRYGGDVLYLHTCSDGKDFQHSWDGGAKSLTLQHWTQCSQQVATAAEQLASRYSMVLIFLHDVPFVAVRKYLNRSVDNVYTVYIPHSLGVSFDDMFAQERRQFEADGFAHLRQPYDFIGYVSAAVQRTLIDHYRFPPPMLLPFINGVYQPSAQFSGPATEAMPAVPTGKKIIFCWGRLSPQKGYDLLIPAVARFLAEPCGQDYHLMVIAPHKSGGGDYFRTITQQLRNIPRARRWVSFEYSRSLPFSILADPATQIVVLPSRFESFGLTAVEAGLFATPNAQLVYSPIDTFEEFFADQAGCHALAELSVDAIHRALCSIATGPTPSARAPFSEAYGFAQRYAAGLDALQDQLEYERCVVTG